MFQIILMELIGANGVMALKDAPALSTGNAHSVTDSVSYLHMMMDSSTDLEYIESAYGASSDSNSLEEKHNPRGHNHKKPQHSKLQGGCKNEKTDKDEEPKKNTCPRSHIELTRTSACGTRSTRATALGPSAMSSRWLSTFKPHHKCMVELGGYGEKEDAGSN